MQAINRHFHQSLSLPDRVSLAGIANDVQLLQLNVGCDRWIFANRLGG
jgi:hypothetical protein